MTTCTKIWIALAGLLASGAVAASSGREPLEPPERMRWDARAAEHLFNRAGFGARPAEIDAAVKLGQAACVAALLADSEREYEPFFVDVPELPPRDELKSMGEGEKRDLLSRYRREHRDLLLGYSGWWIERMLSGEGALRERMTLFWHGTFTSSFRDVKDAALMARQNELFRRHALGSFAELLREAVRDPALIEYLDNDKSKKSNPNENLARELMELFTLGEGNYTEEDVKEAARALTGWRTERGRRSGEDAEFDPRQHDRGEKTVLGVKGRLDGDDLISILLEQPACPRWIARKLLVHFEGREPGEARLAEYAAFLKEKRYDVRAFLERLFLDPEFYSDDVVGSRIAGPVEYLVGSCRRLGLDPPPQLLWLAAGQLGQRLFDPPNVKGWEGGTAWITTSSLLQRGNVAGMLLGVVKLEDVLAPEMPNLIEDDPGMRGAMDARGEGMDAPRVRVGKSGEAPAGEKPAKPKKQEMGPELGAMRKLLGEFYRPQIYLTARCRRVGALSDAAIVDALGSEILPVALTSESRGALLAFLADERKELGVEDGRVLDQPEDAERLLRRLAHLILSLPEAQLG